MAQFYLKKGKDYYALVKDNGMYKAKVDTFFTSRADFTSIDEIRKTAKKLKLDKMEFDIPDEVKRSVQLQDFEDGTSRLETMTRWPVYCHFRKEIAVIKRVDL